MIRIAAAADIHAGPESAGTLKPLLAGLKDEADLLLLAGDLTRSGKPHEVETLVEELSDVGVPIVAVLGNHDYHSDRAAEIARILKDAGIHVLDRSGIVLDVAGRRVAIAGTKGFGGGFGAALASDFGEPEMKTWIRHAETEAETLEDVLTALVGDVRIVLLHYSPVPDTLDGERLDLYPFLGNSMLGEAIDRSGADLVLHGHAHHGSPVGATPSGVPVRNVAQTVVRAPYVVFTIEPEDEIEPPRILPRRGSRRDDEPPAGENREERRRRPRWTRRRGRGGDPDPAGGEDGGS